MQTLNTLFSRWTKAAGLLLIAGALAWAIKLTVIIASDGRIIDTGAAALFMKIGLLLLFVGSTGIGARLSARRARILRGIAIALSPLLLFASFLLFSWPIVPLFRNSPATYAQQEAPIGVAVLVSLTIGILLYRSYRPAVR